MKKLFALFLSIAMIASLFSGVAFALTPTHKVVLNTTSFVTSGEQYGTFTITGSITNNDGVIQAGAKQIVMYHNNLSHIVYQGTTSSNGTFAFLVPTTLPVGQYKIAVWNGSVVDATVAEATFTVKYAVTLSNTLEYTFGSAQVVIQGTVKDSTGKAIEGADVDLTLEGTPIMGTAVTTTSTGQFGFIVNGWSSPGKLWLRVNNVPHIEGKVNPVGLTVVAKPSSNIPHTVATTEIKLEVSGAPTSATPVYTKIYKGTEATANERTSLFTIPTPNTDSDGEATVTFSSNFSNSTLRAGTYTAVVTAGNYKGSTTFTVVEPSRITLVDPSEHLKELPIGDRTLVFGPDNIRIVEIDANGNPTNAVFVYTVWVDGEEEITKETRFDGLTKGDVTITSKALGNVAIKVVAHRRTGTTGNYTYSKVYENTFNVPVVGWAVEYDVTTMTVKKDATVTFIVKDKDGKFVNNANVVLTYKAGTTDEVVKEMSAWKANIQNGTYVFEDLNFSKPGNIDIAVQVLGSSPVKVRAEFDAGIKVLGEKVYSVSSNVETLLVGKEQRITLTISEDGKTFIPHAMEVQVGTAAATALTGYTILDTNSDGIADAIRFDYTATGTKDIKFRAKNADGTKMGEVVVKAVAPKLHVTGNEYLTNNIETKLTFKVVDPRDDSVLTGAISAIPNHMYAIVVKDGEERTINVSSGAYPINGDTSYTLLVTADVRKANWDAAKDAEEVVELSFKLGTTTIAGTFPVKNPTLVSDPATVLIGVPNNMTLTYTDANGAPIVGKEVKIGTTLISETNADGKVFYALAQGATTSAEFFAETDTANTVKLVVAAGFDNAAPEVTAPATVDTATAVITIKDNVRVARLMVNGVEVNIFPLPTILHPVTLKPGTNTFAVIAMDANYNVVEKTVTIVRTAATKLEATIGQAGYTVDGVKVDMAAPYYKNSFTMVPLRMLEGLGAVITWDQATETATLVYGGNTVKITIGSTTATVNGVIKTMPIAPEISSTRTMIPTRFVSEELGFNVEWIPGPPDKLVVSPK